MQFFPIFQYFPDLFLMQLWNSNEIIISVISKLFKVLIWKALANKLLISPSIGPDFLIVSLLSINGCRSPTGLYPVINFLSEIIDASCSCGTGGREIRRQARLPHKRKCAIEKCVLVFTPQEMNYSLIREFKERRKRQFMSTNQCEMDSVHVHGNWSWQGGTWDWEALRIKGVQMINNQLLNPNRRTHKYMYGWFVSSQLSL